MYFRHVIGMRSPRRWKWTVAKNLHPSVPETTTGACATERRDWPGGRLAWSAVSNGQENEGIFVSNPVHRIPSCALLLFRFDVVLSSDSVCGVFFLSSSVLNSKPTCTETKHGVVSNGGSFSREAEAPQFGCSRPTGCTRRVAVPYRTRQ